MKRNIILFAIAMMAVIAFAGSAQASVVGGQINSTTIDDTHVVTLYIDGYPDMIVNTSTIDGSSMAPPYYDMYQFTDISALLANAGLTGQAYNATIEMRCGYGNNVYRNTTPTTAHVSGVDNGDTYFASLMELEPCAVEEPDLIVSEISINPSYSSTGDAIFVNANNEICATVLNDGTGDVTGNFDVNFYDDANNVNMGSATVTGGLLAGQNTTVCIDWTPSCLDYPVSTDYPASGIPITLNVTADCNDAITETDETNNTLLMNTGVYVNGYKSKNFDCDATDPLTPFKYAGDQFTGGLVYNVSGTKGYPFVSGENQTRVHHIDLPSGATVKDARLYITWYDYWYNPSPGVLPNLSVDFAGSCGSATFTTPDAMYTDQKAFDGYNTPKGKYAYNVTSLVCNTSSNDYSVIVENIDPTYSTTLLGGILVVVYEGGEEEIQLWWQEGCDYLSGRTAYGSSTTEATATVEFPGSIIDLENSTANLITFVDQGMASGSNLLFNGINIKTDAWDSPTEAYPDSKINVENVPVDVLASSNNMGFQDTGTSGMQANLAFLVVKQIDVFVEMDEYEMSTPGTMVAPIMLRNIENYGAGTITVSYDPSVVHVMDVASGSFSTVVSSNPDNNAGTVMISAQNTVGKSGDIEFARLTFEAVGSDTDTTPLSLSVQTLKDTPVEDTPGYNNLAYQIDNGSITLREAVPPVMSNESADSDRIIQTIIDGRARPADRAISTLSIDVVDTGSDVKSVTIDLSPIGGDAATTMSLSGGDTYSVTTDATSSINLVHNLMVTATDKNDNTATSTITLEVLRRGDVVRNNKVDMGDALYIARHAVKLEPDADNWELVGDVVGEAGTPLGDGLVDMGDALYISRLTVDLETDEP